MLGILVTVGSTRFDALVHAVLHPRFLAALPPSDEVALTIQYGASQLEPERIREHALQSSTNAGTAAAAADELSGSVRTAAGGRIQLQLVRYTSDLAALIGKASIVISHAGSGTILEVLRTTPRAPALLVVPNHTLMDDHQSELALALGREGYLAVGHLHSGDADVAAADAAQLGEQVRTLAGRIASNKEEDRIRPFPNWQPERFAALVHERLFGA